jgi:hypothetical protein
MHAQSNPVGVVPDLPTQDKADAIAQATWAGIDACEQLEMHLGKLVREEAFGSVNVEQVGVLTLLAYSLEAAAMELTSRAESISRAAVTLARA